MRQVFNNIDAQWGCHHIDVGEIIHVPIIHRAWALLTDPYPDGYVITISHLMYRNLAHNEATHD